ncbi:MAG TPA: hypothetical protein VIW19_06675 [Gaiellaceae bacterium]|jgi:hypothetical protein
MRLTFALGLVVAALVASGVSSCLQTGGQRRAALRNAAKSLLPPQAHIRALGFGDCVELASSPSCARVVFELPERPSALRAKRVRAAAEANGWTVTHSGDGQGGWSLFLRRGDFEAYASLWRPEVYGLRCDGAHPKDECFNTINLERNG